MIMLRLAILRHQPRVSSRRWMAAATAKQKRALDDKQLQGPPEPPTPPPLLPPPPRGVTRPLPPSGGSGVALPIAAVAVVTVGGAYYYFNVINKAEVEEFSPVVAPKDLVIRTPASGKPVNETSPLVDNKGGDTQDKIHDSEVLPDTGNRVVTIAIPPKMKNTSLSQPVAMGHPVDGHRVSFEIAEPTSIDDSTKTEQAIAELQQTATENATQALLASHQSLTTNLDESYFVDMDTLSQSQLKSRIVQLATEMRNRTKWEAVRLKEFLAMKEKETADQYMQIMQKQRLEFEDLLAQRLREQEYSLRQQMQQVIQDKDEKVQNVLKSALDAQKGEHDSDKRSYEETLTAEIQSRLEEQYSQLMDSFKEEMAVDLEKKVSHVEGLTKKLRDLESALTSSQTNQKGSARAHRLSAAALAFAEKLETSKGASQELSTLKIAAGKDGVIATAVKTIPERVASGVPTLSELQTRFEEVHNKSRQAALVPKGRHGLGGQLAGMLFANVKYSPNPDDPVSDTAVTSAEFVLSRAKKYVQMGELENAVEELEKLGGQPALTVADWKRDAMDRILVEKALKAIRMECALLNEKLVTV